MNRGADAEVPVLVVGAGPAGLMTCLLLSRYGVRSVLVERTAQVSPLPRAMGVNARTMEIFRGLGLAPEVEAISVDIGDCPFQVELNTLRGPVLDTVARGGATHVGGPASPTPARFVFCTQNRLESMLLDKLTATGLCEVRRGAELTGLSQDASGVTARLRERSANVDRLVRAAYVVGADGAHSIVRAQLGIGMRGRDHLSRELNILFDADLWSILGDVRAILYHLTNPRLAGPCLFRNVDGRQRWSLLTAWFDDPSLARCRQLIRLCAADPRLDVEVVAVGEWERATLLADEFRRGRVFLAGDACHRVTPAGAFGMNTSIQTAHNLAWKLAGVLQGWAGPGLLDTYETERRPWTAQTVELSFRLNSQHRRAATRTLGHVLGTAYDTGAFIPDGTPQPPVVDPIADYVVSARPGRRAPHAWLTRQGRQISTIDLFDGPFVLLSRAEAWHRAGHEVASELPVPLRAEIIAEPAWADTYQVGDHGAVLVRPDGHVAWRRSTPASHPARELHHVLAAVLDLQDSAMPETGAVAIDAAQP
jgi:2-polyprenyl-6-methoxyphenol hydroxylase-like FAD-dependent oxidoreductase